MLFVSGLKCHKQQHSIQPDFVSDIFEEHEGTHILQSLDGFAIALNSDGRFLYISETVSIYLGLSQVEMTGSSVFDYVHQSDHVELAEQLGVTLAHHQRISAASMGVDGAGGGMDQKNAPVGSIPSIPDGTAKCHIAYNYIHQHYYL